MLASFYVLYNRLSSSFTYVFVLQLHVSYIVMTCAYVGQDVMDEDPIYNPEGKNNHSNCNSSRNHVAPTVVHVSRPKDVEKQRMGLPIVMMEQEIMEAINENISLIICGETGCGKTTQVPQVSHDSKFVSNMNSLVELLLLIANMENFQFLYEAGFGSRGSNNGGGIIGVTQPRRVAVLATAKRVAYELGLRFGKEVGFQVRHDRKVGENCSIKFMTDGILLREVQVCFHILQNELF